MENEKMDEQAAGEKTLSKKEKAALKAEIESERMAREEAERKGMDEEEEVEPEDIPESDVAPLNKNKKTEDASSPDFEVSISGEDLLQFLSVGSALDLTEVRLDILNGEMKYASLDVSQVSMCVSSIKCDVKTIPQGTHTAFNIMQLRKFMQRKLFTFSGLPLRMERKGGKLSITSAYDLEKLDMAEIETGGTISKEPTMEGAAVANYPQPIFYEDVAKGCLISSHSTFDWIPALKSLFVRAVGDAHTLIRKSPATCNSEAPQKATYPNHYLLEMAKVVRKLAIGEGMMQFHFKTNAPCMIEMAYAGGKGRLKYYLAPRVESD